MKYLVMIVEALLLFISAFIMIRGLYLSNLVFVTFGGFLLLANIIISSKK